jgi:hypothetical protein
MLRTFKAVLTGDRLKWTDEIPETGENSLLVHVTLLEEDATANSSSRGQQMAEILSQLAAINTFAEINPVNWQREIRQDRPLPNKE